MILAPQNAEEEEIIEALNKLKDQLSDSNYLSIGNLSSLTTNIEFFYNYTRQGLLTIINQKKKIEEKLKRLENRLKKNGLSNFLYDEFEEGEEIEGEYNKRMQQLLSNYMPHVKADHNQAATGKDSMKKKKQCDDRSDFSTSTRRQQKEKTRREYSMATSFVKNLLTNKMEEDTSKGTELPKNSILNLYVKWREQNSRPVEYKYLSSIQMALTNELKRQFPRSIHNSRSFKGIKFRQQHRYLMKTDVKPRENEGLQDSEEEISPPLPDFDDDPKD